MEVKAWLAAWLAVAALASATPQNNLSRERRSLKKLPLKIPVIGALIGGSSLASAFGFGGGQPESEPQIPDLSQYPLWKVHRYHGISLQPIPLPGNEVHHYPPHVDGEPPSIVNAPRPDHGPQVILPAYEYGVPPSRSPAPSAPYAPADHSGQYAPAPSGPYAPPSAPYPTVTQAPYPSAAPAAYPQAAPAPYPAPAPPTPTAPYPPDYSATYSPSGAHSSAHSAAHSSSVSSVGQIGGYTDSYTLPPYLPPEMVQKIQQYIATPEGRSKADILLGLVSGAQNLKSSAVGAVQSSLQSVMQKLFGGAGGSSNVAIESGTYTDIPQKYPEQQGILNHIRAVGTGVSGSGLPNLPEVSPLPSIPGLKHIPEAPALPHINLPAISGAHAHTGQKYVSISLPQPAPAVIPSAPPPADYYPPTPIIPSTSYGTPIGPTYPYSAEGGDISTFFQQPENGYGVPGDVAAAASEDQGQFEPFVPEDYQGQERNNDQEVNQDQDAQRQQAEEQTPLVPLRTTKLHRVQDNRLSSDDLRSFAARRPVYKGFRPMANQQNDNEVAEDPEN